MMEHDSHCDGWGCAFMCPVRMKQEGRDKRPTKPMEGTEMKNQTIYTPAEVAKMLDRHFTTVARWAKDGKLPGANQNSPGGHWRIPTKGVQEAARLAKVDWTPPRRVRGGHPIQAAKVKAKVKANGTAQGDLFTSAVTLPGVIRRDLHTLTLDVALVKAAAIMAKRAGATCSELVEAAVRTYLEDLES